MLVAGAAVALTVLGIAVSSRWSRVETRVPKPDVNAVPSEPPVVISPPTPSALGPQLTPAATSTEVGLPPPPSSSVGNTSEEALMITLMFSASPESAHFSLDEGRLLPNPYQGSVPRDDREHVVLAVAEGYAPRFTKIHFTKDLILDVALERVDSTKTPSGSRGVGPQFARPSSPLPSTKDPSGSRGPGRVGLDQSDPWANTK